MNMRSNRRGFTLVELTLVMAVLAIVLVMVTSFTAMVTGSRELSAARLEALQDIKVAESIIENFIEENGDVEYSVNSLTAGENTLAFNPESKTLVVKDGATLTLERVESITFDTYGEGAEKIYYCTIHYTVVDHDYDYKFCVYSYAGNGGTNEQG